MLHRNMQGKHRKRRPKVAEPKPWTVRWVIRTARGEQSPNDFAKRMGTTQPSLWKYEHGRTNPPAKLIDKCLAILSEQGKLHRMPPAFRATVTKLQTTLARPEHQETRGALKRLVEFLVSSPQG
jgi:transcriptional regulator with XRE-family HTH domain